MARHPALVNIRTCSVLALMLGGCSYLPPAPELPRDVFTTPITNRGHAVTQDQLAQINPGVTTRADVQALLGSPSQTGTFSDDNWYYISGTTQLRPARAIALRAQNTVAISFNGNGTVSGVRQINLREMPNVDFVGRETPSPGNERSLLQALFGNVGRFGPTPGGQPASVGGPPVTTGR